MAQFILNTGAPGQDVALAQTSTQPTAKITLKARTELVAPATVWLEVENQSGFSVSGPSGEDVYDPLEQEIEYFWNFDDPGSMFRPPVLPLNVPDVWKDANHSKGVRATKTFHSPGTYTVSVLAVCPGGFFTYATIDIDVKAEYGNPDPADDIYTRIICFATDGDFTDAPPQTTNFVSSWAALNTLWPGMSDDKVLLLFKRGNTFPDASISSPAASQNVATMRWGAYGIGAAPILSPPADGSDAIAGSAERTADWQEHVVRDLHIQGQWDARTATGFAGALFANDYGAIDPSTTKTPGRAIVRCYIDGMTGGGFKGKRTVAADQAVCWSECYVTNWKNNGIFDNRGQYNIGWKYRLSFVGTAFAQHEDALRTVGIDILNYLGCRLGNPSDLDIDACWFFNNMGYAGSQPALRNMSAGLGSATQAQHDGRYHQHFYRTVFEGGSPPLNFEYPFAGNYVIDSCLFMGTARTDHMIKTAVALTLRNSYCFEPARESEVSAGYYLFRMNNQSSVSAAGAAVPLRIYGNTFVTLASTAEFGKQKLGIVDPELADFYDTVVEENNVLWTPNMDTPLDVGGPIDTSVILAGYTPRHKGEIRLEGASWFPEGTSLGASVPHTSSRDFPYPIGADQTFWLARTGIHDQHAVQVGKRSYNAELGQITVEFLPGAVRVTNFSGTTWNADEKWYLALDWTGTFPSQVPGHLNPDSIPLPRPGTGSDAINGGGTGLMSLSYFDTTIRKGTVHPDAAPGTPDRGALPAV
ncbi:MAG: hypothetical protein AAGK37_07310 [Pseudomonadota bacterium]